MQHVHGNQASRLIITLLIISLADQKIRIAMPPADSLP
jgi:hypothetical protein